MTYITTRALFGKKVGKKRKKVCKAADFKSRSKKWNLEISKLCCILPAVNIHGSNDKQTESERNMTSRIISFANQKGGVGKSTLLMLTAAAMHNRTGKKVLVIDCDPQRSIKEVYAKEGRKDAYDVIAFNWKQPKAEVNFDKTIALAESKYEVVFVDIPGRLEGREIYFSILISDVVIVPLVASTLDIASSVSFLKTLPQIRQIKQEKGFSLDIFGVINKRDQTLEHHRLTELEGIGGMEFFQSGLSNLVRYRRNISTAADIADPSHSDDEFNHYFEEFRRRCRV